MDEPEVTPRCASRDCPRSSSRRLRDPAVKQELLENTERWSRAEPSGSPTFFVGDEIFFGKDRLRDVEEEIEAQKR